MQFTDILKSLDLDASLFKGGEAVDKITGLQAKANLKKRIDAVIA